MQLELDNCLERGIRFLESNQLKDGSFISLTWTDNPKKVKRHNSIFPSCLILSCLKGKKSEKTRNKLANFLISQKSDSGSFNYWKRGSTESKKMPYPDDLDDTFCALSALCQHDSELIKADILAKSIDLLVFLEKKEGGPYKTWLVSPESDEVWKDVDLAVNSNVAFFLSLQEVYLKNIEKLVEEAISKNAYYSRYYHSEFPVIYFISRFYKGKNKKKIIDLLLTGRTGKGKNLLNTAMIVSSLLNLGFKKCDYLKEDVDFLISSQNRSGGWEAFPLTIELKKDGKIFYAGSPELTSAFCLEAIQKYKDKSASSDKKGSKDEKYQKIKETIIKETKEKFCPFGKDIQEKLDEILRKITKKDSKDQITMLPYFFRESLGKNDAKKIDDGLIIKLGSANLLGWIAYSIYDDFLDGEGEAQMLPIANVCLRRLSGIFFEIGSAIQGFSRIFVGLMDDLEKTNFWEISNCRAKKEEGKISIPQKLPDYKDLLKISNRSMGHILGIVSISLKLGCSQNEIEKIIACFRHHIVSKQLNDDAHDWEEDIKKGNLSPVVCDILKKFRKNYRKDFVYFSEDKEKLRKIFWTDLIGEISKNIIQNCLKSKKIVKTVKIIEKPDLFLELFQSIENSAKKTLKEKREVEVFLKNI